LAVDHKGAGVLKQRRKLPPDKKIVAGKISRNEKSGPQFFYTAQVPDHNEEDQADGQHYSIRV
jgi:hypothetical protein